MAREASGRPVEHVAAVPRRGRFLGSASGRGVCHEYGAAARPAQPSQPQVVPVGGYQTPWTTTASFTASKKGTFRWYCALACDAGGHAWAMEQGYAKGRPGKPTTITIWGRRLAPVLSGAIEELWCGPAKRALDDQKGAM